MSVSAVAVSPKSAPPRPRAFLPGAGEAVRGGRDEEDRQDLAEHAWDVVLGERVERDENSAEQRQPLVPDAPERQHHQRSGEADENRLRPEQHIELPTEVAAPGGGDQERIARCAVGLPLESALRRGWDPQSGDVDRPERRRVAAVEQRPSRGHVGLGVPEIRADVRDVEDSLERGEQREDDDRSAEANATAHARGKVGLRARRRPAAPPRRSRRPLASRTAAEP